MDEATRTTGPLSPGDKSCNVCDTDSCVQIGFHYRDCKKNEKQPQPFVCFKNEKIRQMRQVGVSKPSQSPFRPFIARLIALVFHEMLLKVVYFKV